MQDHLANRTVLRWASIGIFILSHASIIRSMRALDAGAMMALDAALASLEMAHAQQAPGTAPSPAMKSVYATHTWLSYQAQRVAHLYC
jgi:hypothetical protein